MTFVTTFANTRDGLLSLLDGVLNLNIHIPGDGNYHIHVPPVLVRLTHGGALLLVRSVGLGVSDCIFARK